jgi:hypothetical protein
VGVYLWHVLFVAPSAQPDNTLAGRIGLNTQTSRSAASPKRKSSASIYHRFLAPPKTKVRLETHSSCLESLNFPPAPEHLSALAVHDSSQELLGSMPDPDGEVVILTHLPRSRWQTLLNLDVIQVSFSFFLSVSYTVNYFG